MAPRRSAKLQQTRLKFNKLRTAAGSSRNPSLSQTSPSNIPLPRPTAPPFFNASTPRVRRSLRANAKATDEAWEAAKRLINGDSTPPVRIVEEGAPVQSSPESTDMPQPKCIEPQTPVQSISGCESDEDFESDGAIARVSRQRPKAVGCASHMRNDRSSMTKRSGTKLRKTRKVFYLSTPTKRANLAEKRNATDSPPSSSEEEFGHFVFEGEKSELSGTDNEDNDLRHAITPSKPKKSLPRTGKLEDAEMNSKRGESNLISDSESVSSPRPSAPVRLRRLRRFSIQAETGEHTEIISKNVPSTGQTDELVEREADYTKSTPKKRRRLPTLLADDSEDSIEIRRSRSSNRKGIRAHCVTESSSSEDEELLGTLGQSTAQRLRHRLSALKASAEKNDSKETASYSSLKSTEIASVIQTNEVNQSSLKADHAIHILKGISDPLKTCDLDSPKSTPKRTPRRKLTFTPSQKIQITPPSTPSPPSTKRRTIRSKLFPTCSDDESDVQAKTRCKPTKRRKIGANSDNLGVEVKRTGNEWYHERDIGAFSSSSDDFKAPSRETSSPNNLLTTRSTKRVSARKPPTRRNLLRHVDGFLQENLSPKKDYSSNVEENAFGHSDDFANANLATQSPVGKYMKKGLEISKSPSDCIDLVDDSDFEDNVGALKPANTHTEVQEVGDSRNSERFKKSPLPADVEDDSKPPPFNLFILCKEGESIVEMRDRLGEDALMDKVMEAQNGHREIIGGEQLGLNGTFNKTVFSRFSETVVGDQIGRERKAVSVTEKALRGEYKFNYRGRNRDNQKIAEKKGSGLAAKPAVYKGRLANLRRRRR